MADDKVTFTAPHFSEMGLYLAAERTDPDVTENRTVTVIVGKTDSNTITGANYAGDTYVTENPDIAAVTVTGTDEQKESYNPKTVFAGDLANYNSSWTKTDYYYYTDDYYPVYGKYETTGLWWNKTTTYYWGYSTTDSAANVTVIDSSTDYDTQVTVYTKSSDPTPASTTVTFTGKRAGTTYVTVGTVRYTINVVAENLDGVNALPIQLWITNNTIQVDETDKTKTATGSGWGGDRNLDNANYVSVAAGRAYGEQGVTLKEAIGLSATNMAARDSSPFKRVSPRRTWCSGAAVSMILILKISRRCGVRTTPTPEPSSTTSATGAANGRFPMTGKSGSR